MAHFANVNENNIVTDVLVVSDDYENNAQDYLVNVCGLEGTWIQTSYNTYGGVHANGKMPIHKNYAGIGYTFDGVGFAAPKPFESWTLNPDSYLWEAPTPIPTDGKIYNWDESTLTWVEVTI